MCSWHSLEFRTDGTRRSGFFNQHHDFELQPCRVYQQLSFSVFLRNIPLCGYTTFCLYHFLFIPVSNAGSNIRVVYSLGLLQIKLCTWVCNSTHVFISLG